MKVRIAGLTDDSVVDGDGCRFAVFVQGCPHRCPHCHNPETHAFQGGTEMEIDDIWQQIRENPLLSGITLSGGEPFCQPEPLTELARKAHAAGMDVWSYTGYTWEQLEKMQDPSINALMEEVDVLVDGPYLHEQRDLALRFRGSRNQRVLDLKKSRTEHRPVLLYTD